MTDSVELGLLMSFIRASLKTLMGRSFILSEHLCELTVGAYSEIPIFGVVPSITGRY